MNDENEMTCMFVIEGADPGIEWDGRDQIAAEACRLNRKGLNHVAGTEND